MSSEKGLVTKSYLVDIADTIRTKLDSSAEMTVAEMAGNIAEIPAPAGRYDISENGSYDIANYAYVDVTVSGGVVPTGSYDITVNGSYDITNYAKANVSVPQGVFPSGSYDITENGSYDITNYAKVNVEVPLPEGSYDITENGSYDITDYVKVNVSVEPDESTIIDTLNNADSGPQNWDLLQRGDGLEWDKPYVLSYLGSHGYGGWDQWEASSYEVPEGSYDVTQNGSYDITDYAKVNVAVPQGVFPAGTYPVAANGSYDVTNYAGVRVLVPGPTGSYDIAQNGSYDITNYAKVNVEVPSPLPADTGLYFLPYETQGSAGFISIVGWEEGEDWRDRYVQLGSATCELLSESAVVVESPPAEEGLYVVPYKDGSMDFIPVDTSSNWEDWDEGGRYAELGSAGCTLLNSGSVVAEADSEGHVGIVFYSDNWVLPTYQFMPIDVSALGGEQVTGLWASLGSASAYAVKEETVIQNDNIPDMSEGDMIIGANCEDQFVIVKATATEAVLYSAQIPDMAVGNSISVTSADGNHDYTLIRNT